MSASSMPSEFFSSLFRSTGSLLPIGRHSTSFRSARLQTGRLPSLFILFSFGPTCMLFNLSIALRLRHDLSKALRLHLAWRLVRHGYPWVPTDQAHGSPGQVGPAY
jgi:hypothetical protein